MIRLRHLAEINPATPEFEHLPSDAEVPFVPLEAVWPEGVDSTRRKLKGEATTGYTRFREGDIVVPKITPTFQANRTTIAAGLEGGVAAGTTELHVVRPGPNVDGRYVRYLLSSRPFLHGGEAEMIGVAGQKRVPDAWLRDLRVSISSVAEQRAIADFLDAETTRIDALVAKKRRLLDVLDERLRADVLVMMTGEPSGPSWEPGPHWLGPVPRSWVPHKIAWRKQTASGTTPESGNPAYYDSERGVPWVTTTDLRESVITDSSKYVTTAAFRDHSALKVFPAGTTLVAMYGATVGRLGVLGVPAATNQACCAVFGSGGLDQRFLYWWLWVNRKHLVSMAYGAGQPNISQEVIRGLRVPAPDVAEQAVIAERAEKAHTRFDHVRERVARQIDRFVEHRQALITAAVTGELSVAGVAA